MSELYNTLLRLCEAKGISGYRMCKDVGIQPSVMTDLKMGRRSSVKVETAQRIASYFGVSVEFLLGFDGDDRHVVCDDCGFQFDATNKQDVKIHEEHHKAWSMAVSQYGFCWSAQESERMKNAAQSGIASGELTGDEYIEAQLNIFKALFSRSLEKSGFDLRHASFPAYVAMLLNQQEWKNTINPFVYKELVDRFGVKEGIASGTRYAIPAEKEKAPTPEGEREITFDDFTYAMYEESKDLPPEKKQMLLEMARFMKADMGRDK